MIIRNFKNFVKNHTALFIFLSLAQIVSIVIIMFSYGVFINSKLGINDLEYEGMIYDINFKASETTDAQNVAKLKEMLPEILGKYETDIEFCRVATFIPDMFSDGSVEYDNYFDREYYVAHFNTDGKRYKNVELVPEKYLLGRTLNDADENGDKPVCLITRQLADSVGGIWQHNDMDYEIVGLENILGEELSYTSKFYLTFGFDRSVIVPFKFLPEDSYVEELVIRFTRVILMDEVEEMNAAFAKYFDDDIRSYPTGVEISYDKEKTLKSMIWIVGLLAILAARSMISIYVFVLKKREKETGIFIVCGASKGKIVIAYITELMLQFLISAGIGFSLFQFVLRSKLDVKYKWFHYIFVEQMGDCFKLLAVFAIVVMIVSSISVALTIKKTPISIIKQGEK